MKNLVAVLAIALLSVSMNVNAQEKTPQEKAKKECCSKDKKASAKDKKTCSAEEMKSCTDKEKKAGCCAKKA